MTSGSGYCDPDKDRGGPGRDKKGHVRHQDDEAMTVSRSGSGRHGEA